ncbi:MAG: hypothetical protein AAF567_01475 [Actinomycetota bacterium]
MNEVEDTPSLTTGEPVPASGATPTTAPTAALDARPDVAWLDTVEGEVEDVDVVLKCLARDSATVCATCDGLQAAGALDDRPVLARCASTKQPR